MSVANVDGHVLAKISGKHGLPIPDVLPTPWSGATSVVYPVGDTVIKIAYDRPDALASVTTDAAMNPVIRNLGVCVPPLLVFDDDRDILPVPVAIYQRVTDAVPLEDSTHTRDHKTAAWEAVGRDLALVHAVTRDTTMALAIPLREFRQTAEVDPRSWVDELCAEGTLRKLDGAWLGRLLDLLAPAALGADLQRLCHGDVNASNVLVDRTSGAYRALIDWAGAGWLDPVWDFVGVPLDIASALLAGHRSIAPLPMDETAEMRMCWCQIQTRLFNARSLIDRTLAASSLDRDLAQIRIYSASQGWIA